MTILISSEFQVCYRNKGSYQTSNTVRLKEDSEYYSLYIARGRFSSWGRENRDIVKIRLVLLK